MRNSLRTACVVSICVSASACGVGRDSVLFVTNTNIGIDVDRAPPNVAIAFDRYEGYFGPAYETGALAPVVARLESNTSVFAPKIRQLYATGDAAALVTQSTPSLPDEKPLKCNDKRVAFFGTGSVVGLKVAFDPNGTPQSLALGYKRKEFSLIPVMKQESDRTDKYGSVLASFGINVETLSLPGTTFGVDQFFATGAAAENLAVNEESIRDYFVLQATNAMSPKPTPFYYDQCSAKLKNWLNMDKKNNADALNHWINDNKRAGCDTGGNLMYTEACKDLCQKAATGLAVE